LSSACGVAELLAGVEDCNVTIAAVPRRNLFWGMFGIYLVACFTMLHLGCPRRKRRRGARVCKKQLPRTHVLCTLKGPRNCRRIGRMRKKHARLLPETSALVCFNIAGCTSAWIGSNLSCSASNAALAKKPLTILITLTWSHVKTDSLVIGFRAWSFAG